MSDALFYTLSGFLSLMVLLGIHWLSKVETAVRGNRLSAVAMLLAIAVVFLKYEILGVADIWIGLMMGTLASILISGRIKMIVMPQLVGLLNGLGGLASAVAAILTLLHGVNISRFEQLTALIAMAVGAFTLSGSLVAAGKLHKLLPQKPVQLPYQQLMLGVSFTMMLILILVPLLIISPGTLYTWLLLIAGILFGLLFALPVGGADMPITISLLNSTSGIAAAITGMAVGNVLLVSVGGIVGASGLLLTLMMCRSMNRKLYGILFSRRPVIIPAIAVEEHELSTENDASSLESKEQQPVEAMIAADESQLEDWIAKARSIIIIPGYGMAVSQAQELVKQLQDKLEQRGREVRYAIHPVAGRMPGHMNVLLAEVDIPYDKLFEMDDINPHIEKTDLVFVVGANDVINPAANSAQGTPIYGMPVLNAGNAKKLVICNFDRKPGYAGVDNPLYEDNPHILLMLGDAKDSLNKIIANIG